MQTKPTRLYLRPFASGALIGLGLLALTGAASARTLNVAPATFAQDGTGACVVNSDATLTCPTLRAAIINANEIGNSTTPDVINLPTGAAVLTVGARGEDASREGDLDIMEDLVINGGSAVASETVINAQLMDRVFHVLKGVKLTLNNLTVKNGRVVGQDGGGIHVAESATLTATNVRVENSVSEPLENSGAGGNTGGAGGGIYNEGTLSATGLELRNNAARSANGGGGLFNAALATLENCVIDGNQGGSIGGAGGGIHNTTRSGGAAADNATRLQITNCTISNNIAAGGGGLRNQFGAMIIINSVISGNKASSSGAGIDVAGGGVEIFRTVIRDNNVVNPADSSPTGIGGGIANFASLGLNQSLITGNRAGQGGAIFSAAGSMNLANLTITRNSALSNGGGINTSRNANLLNVTVFDNDADNGTELFLRRDKNAAASVLLRNTLVGNSTGANPCAYDTLFGSDPSGPTRESEIRGIMSSQGHNLETLNTCFLTAATDKVNTNPLIDSTLQLNNAGDPDLPTLALLAGSPAIDAGDNEMCPPLDQRSYQRRSVDDSCDIGAYEVSNVLSTTVTADLKVVMTPTLFSTGSGGSSYQLQYAITVTNNGEANVPELNVVITLPPDVAVASVTGLSSDSCPDSTTNVITCTIRRLNAYTNMQFFVLAVPQNPQVARTLVARVEVRATGSGAPADSNPSNNFIETSTEMRAINSALPSEETCGVTNLCADRGGGGHWGWSGLLLGAPLLRRRRRSIH